MISIILVCSMLALAAVCLSLTSSEFIRNHTTTG
jgi:hypothetical protein